MTTADPRPDTLLERADELVSTEEAARASGSGSGRLIVIEGPRDRKDGVARGSAPDDLGVRPKIGDIGWHRLRAPTSPR